MFRHCCGLWCKRLSRSNLVGTHRLPSLLQPPERPRQRLHLLLPPRLMTVRERIHPKLLYVGEAHRQEGRDGGGVYGEIRPVAHPQRPEQQEGRWQPWVVAVLPIPNSMWRLQFRGDESAQVEREAERGELATVFHDREETVAGEAGHMGSLVFVFEGVLLAAAAAAAEAFTRFVVWVDGHVDGEDLQTRERACEQGDISIDDTHRRNVAPQDDLAQTQSASERLEGRALQSSHIEL